MRYNIIFLTLIAFPFIARSQSYDIKKEIEQVFSTYLSDTINNTGLAVGIILNGSTHIYCFGKTSKSDTGRISPATIFEMGSITKLFTVTLLSENILHKNISPKDHIDRFLPDSVVLQPSMQKKITVMHLATHTSGLPRIPDGFPKHPLTIDSVRHVNFTEADLYTYLQAYHNRYSSGKTLIYSNLGVGLLGHLIALHNHSSYDSLVVNRICIPLGMKNTKKSISAEEKHNLAHGYVRGRQAERWDFDVLSGACSLKSTITDMTIFLHNNIYPGNDSLSIAIINTHESQKRFRYHEAIAMGWFIKKKKGKVYWHNGFFNGQRSFIAFEARKKIGVILLSNSDSSLDAYGFQLIELLRRLSH